MDIDFDGKGYITKSDFDRCVMGLNLPYSVDQINTALGDDSLLTQPDMQMDIKTFQSHFF